MLVVLKILSLKSEKWRIGLFCFDSTHMSINKSMIPSEPLKMTCGDPGPLAR